MRRVAKVEIVRRRRDELLGPDARGELVLGVDLDAEAAGQVGRRGAPVGG